MLDKTTFGDSDAAITLADILNKRENPSLTRKVSRRLIQYNECLNKLAEIDDDRLVRKCSRLVRDDFVKETENARYPTEVKLFVNNVAVGSYRNLFHQRGFNEPS